MLYLGRIVSEKGLCYLVNAWKDVLTDKKLVIAGGSSDTDAFMKELQQNCHSNVLYTGFQQGEILGELYSNAYLYCLPSDLEGMPLSLLEAMSYGNCCLTSDIAECTEVLGDYGISFQKSNVADLRDKLQYLCNHPDIVNSYKRKAANYILNRYNWDDVVRKTLDVYME